MIFNSPKFKRKDQLILYINVEILYIDICITILFRSESSVKDTDGQSGSMGSSPTNFIANAAYSECIAILLSLFYLTLWMCHVHRDGSFRISLMQHSQTSVKPHIHLKKKSHASIFANSENFSSACISFSCISKSDCLGWPICSLNVKGRLNSTCMAYTQILEYVKCRGNTFAGGFHLMCVSYFFYYCLSGTKKMMKCKYHLLHCNVHPYLLFSSPVIVPWTFTASSSNKGTVQPVVWNHILTKPTAKVNN